jgi:hypothetical protein
MDKIPSDRFEILKQRNRIVGELAKRKRKYLDLVTIKAHKRAETYLKVCSETNGDGKPEWKNEAQREAETIYRTSQTDETELNKLRTEIFVMGEDIKTLEMAAMFVGPKWTDGKGMPDVRRPG